MLCEFIGYEWVWMEGHRFVQGSAYKCEKMIKGCLKLTANLSIVSALS